MSSIGDKVVMEEAVVKIEDLDPSYWAYWLAATGYGSQAGGRRRRMIVMVMHACVCSSTGGHQNRQVRFQEAGRRRKSKGCLI